MHRCWEIIMNTNVVWYVWFLVTVISLPTHFFKVVILSLNWCFDTILNAREISSTFFPWCVCHLWDVRPLFIIRSFLVLWSICWSSSLVHLKMVQSIFRRGQPLVYLSVSFLVYLKNYQGRLLRCLFHWWDFSCRFLFWEVFLFL